MRIDDFRGLAKVKKIFLAFAFLAVTMFAGCDDQKKAESKEKVSVLIYSEYIDPAMLEDFKAKTGYELQLELYEAQEEMIGKLQASGSNGYDVIIASDVVIQQMISLGLVAKVDSTKISNRVNVAEKFKRAAYDLTNDYAWPYLWGTTGILYRDSTINPDSVSYSMLFDAKNTKGNFSLLEESRSMISIALLAIGLDPNTTNQEEITKAVDYILQAKKNPHFVGFDGSVSGKDKVLSREDWAAIVFNGEAMAAIDEDSTLRYAIPQEGSFMWVDCMLLSAKAPNPDGAYKFMDYILDAKVGAQLAKYISYATPNSASLAVLDDEFVSNRVINPDKATMDRMVFLADPGEAASLYDEAWTVVKTR